MQNKPKLVKGAVSSNMEIKPIELQSVILLANNWVHEMWRKGVYKLNKKRKI